MNKILLIVVFALTLTACSSNKATLDGSNQATLNVKANEQTDNGYDSSTYVVPAGADITVNFTNDTPHTHVFAVLKQGEHVTPPFLQTRDGDKIIWKVTAQSGETKSGIFTAPTEPGEYDIICTSPGHLDNGMKAKLVVEKQKK